MGENTGTKFKVILEFEIGFEPIKAPGPSQYLAAESRGPVNLTAQKEKAIREGMKAKGLSDGDIENAIIGLKKAKGPARGKSKPAVSPAELLDGEFRQWIDAQKRLQQEILGSADLRAQYACEALRERTDGQLQEILEKAYGPPDPNRILMEAMKRLPESDRETLKAGEEELLSDETELLDDAVTYRFSGMKVTDA